MNLTYTNSLLIGSSFSTLDECTKPNDSKTSFEHLLEFNEEIYLADLVSTKDFYKGLLESGDFVLHETVLGSISGFISHILLTIDYLFSYIFKGRSSDGKENKAAKSYEERIANSLKLIDLKNKSFNEAYTKGKLTNTTINIHQYNYPAGYDIPSLPQVIGEEAVKILSDITKRVQQIIASISNSSSQIETDSILADMDKLIDMVGKLDLADKFTISEELNISVDKFREKVNSISKQAEGFIKNKKSTTPDKFVEYKAFNDTISNLKKAVEAKKNTAEEAVNKIRSLAAKQAEVSTAITNKFNNYCTLAYRNLSREVSEVLKGVNTLLGIDYASDEGEAVEEAAYLENIVNLELANYRWSLMEIYKYGIVEEAKIRMNESSDVAYEMEALNEAIMSKAKNAFNLAIAKIKEIFAKFMEKLRANFTSTKNYLDKYKDIILNNNLPDPSYTCKNLIEGMYRVVDYTIPAFNYNEIKNKLDSYSTFFTEIRPANTANFRASVDPAQSGELRDIATYFKEYFGMTKEDQIITAQVFKQSMRDIYNFMYDIRAIDRKISNDIKRVEGMRNNALRQAGIPTTQTPTQAEDTKAKTARTRRTRTTTPKTTTTQTPQQASFIYGDIGSTLLEMKPNSAQNNTTSNSATTYYNTTGVKSMNNVQKTGVSNSSGEEQYGVAGVTVNEVDAKLKVYTDVTIKVLEAKLTAVEFLRNEFMQLFRILVSAYVDGEAKSAQEAIKNK